jgi:biotin-dependent carboxylase-like uncharacterized protein
MSGVLRVHRAPMAAVTDLGRPRGPRYGLPCNGALDQYSARVANILVGNPEGAPLIEVTAFDARVELTADALISVTGAEAELLVDDVERPRWEPVAVRAGQTVSIRHITGGLRCYLAVHGSFDVPTLLGSCAPDPGIGFGASLADSGQIPLGLAGPAPVSDFWGCSLFNLQVLRPHLGENALVDVIDGPDIEEFGATAERLFAAPYEVTAKSNHVGLRLAGGELPVRATRDEKISRGVPVGALEVPPGDELLILHRGRGVTAGYPVLGVVSSTSLDILGQARPGQQVTLRRCEVDQAVRDARAWREELGALRGRVELAFAALGLDGHLPPTGPSTSTPSTDDRPLRRSTPHGL